MIAALAVSRLMRGLLVGVTATDPVVLLGALGLLLAVGALAAFLPARRASRVDPLVALRQQSPQGSTSGHRAGLPRTAC